MQAESAYLNEGVIPPYAPSKWHISNDAANEIEGAQEYLAALALSNLSSPGAVHGAAVSCRCVCTHMFVCAHIAKAPRENASAIVLLM